MEVLLEYMAKGFLIMLSISMPCVLVAAGIGLVVGILQAVTQVQEQTIAAAPKILGVFLVIIIGGVGYIKLLTNFMQEGASLAFNHVSKHDEFVLDSNYYKYTSPFANEMKDNIKETKSFKNALKNPPNLGANSGKERNSYSPARNNLLPKPDFVETKRILGR